MEVISGFVDHIIFQNPDNAYTVLILTPEDPEDSSPAWEDEDEICVVGNLPGINAGETVKVRGLFTEHETYGRQLKAESYEPVDPRTEEAIIRYLGSGAIKGMRKRLAQRVVKRFGKDSFRIIEEEPERLAEVQGISINKAMEIADQVMDLRAQRGIMMFLDSLGLSASISLSIYRLYGAETRERIKENPYRLVDDIERIGFHTADRIAEKLGLEPDAQFRIDSGMLHVLKEMSSQGHTYLPKDLLIRYSTELLGCGGQDIEESLMRQYISGKVVRRQDAIYLSRLYKAEANCAGFLTALDTEYRVDTAEVSLVLDSLESEEGISLDEIQRKAVFAAANFGITILTGGPGTGKTTTLSAMISYFESEQLDIFLAAPTGRAAKRMSEATGREAKTIHRLLEVSSALERNEDGGISRVRFQRNEDNPLECDVLIVDEMSMVDINLLHSLLTAVAAGTRLIFVGDVNQLPSVGPGNVLSDMIESGRFHVVELKKIFRQAGKSDIVLNAHRINAGEHFPLDNRSKDFFYAGCNEADTIIKTMLRYIMGRLPEYVGAGRLDIQVLTPTRKGNIGVERLNAILQQHLNPPSGSKTEQAFGSGILRTGDKVMQIKNNYDLEWNVCGKHGIVLDHGTGVFNGDMGIITEISPPEKKLRVKFDDNREVEYGFDDADELTLSYAVTIHKSQGSEYPAVLIPLMPGPVMLMNRNLIYTAVTRAKKCVCLVGNSDVFWRMVDSADRTKRYSGLKKRLTELPAAESISAPSAQKK